MTIKAASPSEAGAAMATSSSSKVIIFLHGVGGTGAEWTK